jgi:amidase
MEGLVTHPDCVGAAERAARELEALGHIVDTSSPAALDDHEVGFAGILPAHAATITVAVDGVGRSLRRAVTADDFEPRTWEQAELGRTYDAPSFVAATELIVAWTRRMAEWWQDHDLLLTPTLGTPPPPLGHLAWTNDASTMRALEFSPFCPVWNWTGQPAITLPLGESAEGLPVGVMLVAAYGREDLLLRVAAQLEVACPWRDRRPGIHAANRNAAATP